MVITKMSGETSWEQNDSIQRAIARIRQMQSVLDLVYKSLLQVRSSNFANAHLKLNQAQFQEAKFLRLLAKQLKEKHTELQALEDPEVGAAVEKQFNDLISLEKFLVLAGLERRDIEIMQGSSLNLSMDALFQASEDQLEAMFEDLEVSEVSQKRLKNRLADLKEAYEDPSSRDRSSTASDRLSSVSVPYDDEISRNRSSDCFPPYTPPVTPPVSQSRPYYPASVMVSSNDSGSVESMPAALKRNHWLMNRKPSSIDSHPGHYGSNRAVHSHFRSSEQINHVQLTVPQRHHGHMRTRSLGNDITLAITNGVTVPNEQEVRHPTPSPLPSPTPLTDVKRHTKHRSPPTMVKQASLGAYPDPSQTFNSGNEDEFGESSSLVCFNSYSDGDEDVETVKAQSVPRLISLSVSGDYTQTDPSERFTRSYSEVLPGDRSITVPAPTSPRTQGANTPVGLVGHRIPHRFSSRSFFHSTACDFCKKGMILGVRCKQCKYKCHKNCQKKVPASCGLPQGLENVFIQMMMCPSPAPSVENFPVPEVAKESTKSVQGTNGIDKRYNTISTAQNTISIISNPAHITSPSSSSMSSASLSPVTPISPQDKDRFFSTSSGKGSTVDESSEHELEMRDSDTGSSSTHLHTSSSYDDISDTPRQEGLLKRGPRPSPQIVSVGSLPDLHRPKVAVYVTHETEGSSLRGGSPSLIQTTGSSMTTSTLTNGSIGLNESELGSTTTTLVNSVSSDCHGENLVDGEDGFNLVESATSQQFHREWEIPYNDLTNLSVISEDPFTGVQTLKGYWHGEVMIKKFPVPNATSQQVERFITDVAALKHCRHENVLLFMGICSQPPDLAVITSNFNGVPLYKHIHVWTETFQGRRAHHIIKQVAQGMGYLHDKGIVHKDLTSRHILLDDKDRDNKVVITDVGFNLVTDCQLFPGMKGKLMVPRGWLNYQAPEILKVLSPFETCDKHYTFQSDIYAFGILWYELLTGTWPFGNYEPEQVIYLVGNGARPKTEHVNSTTTVKDILTKCWNYDPEMRIPFAKMLEDLKKRMPVARIASHPTKLSKSMDSIF